MCGRVHDGQHLATPSHALPRVADLQTNVAHPESTATQASAARHDPARCQGQLRGAGQRRARPGRAEGELIGKAEIVRAETQQTGIVCHYSVAILNSTISLGYESNK